jgi:hypothetical protein
MGFNLSNFFKDLEDVMDGDESPEDKLASLGDVIEDAKEYATECGALSNVEPWNE